MNEPTKYTVDHDLSDLFEIFNNKVDNPVDILNELGFVYQWEYIGAKSRPSDEEMIKLARRYIGKSSPFLEKPKHIVIVPFIWIMSFIQEGVNVLFYIACDDPKVLRKHLYSAVNMLAFL